MIEETLKDILQKIFDFKKTTFNATSDSEEQNCLFIELDSNKSYVKDNLITAKVTGKCSVYAPSDKLPSGYFAQRIAAADNDLTKDLFFYDFEQSVQTEVNIVKRGFAFVYFFVGQYDPHADNIQSIVIEGLDT